MGQRLSAIGFSSYTRSLNVVLINPFGVPSAVTTAMPFETSAVMSTPTLIIIMNLIAMTTSMETFRLSHNAAPAKA